MRLNNDFIEVKAIFFAKEMNKVENIFSAEISKHKNFQKIKRRNELNFLHDGKRKRKISPLNDYPPMQSRKFYTTK